MKEKNIHSSTTEELEDDFGMDEDSSEEEGQGKVKEEKFLIQGIPQEGDAVGNGNEKVKCKYDSGKGLLYSEQYQSIMRDLDREVSGDQGSGSLESLYKVEESASTITTSSATTSTTASASTTGTVNKKSADERDKMGFILECNKLLNEIEEETIEIYDSIVVKYESKFPELKSIASSKLQYAKLILIIDHHDSFETVLKELEKIVTENQKKTLAMRWPSRKTLTEEIWKQIEKECQDLVTLCNAKDRISLYLSSRIKLIAPNLCQLLGPEVAVPLLGHVGSLTALVKLPAGNLAGIGMEKVSQPNMNYSSIPNNKSKGTLSQCDILQPETCPEDFKKKCLRLIEYATSKAAKFDLSGGRPDGDYGQELRDGIYEKIDKFLAPTEFLADTAMKIPNHLRKTRRGGWKARGRKRKFGGVRKLDELNQKQFGRAVALDDIYYSAAANDGDEEEDYLFENDLIADTQDTKTKDKIRRIQREEAQKRNERQPHNNKKNKNNQPEKVETELDVDFTNNHLVHQILNDDGGIKTSGSASALSSFTTGNASSASALSLGMQSTISYLPNGTTEVSNPFASNFRKKRVEEANAKWFSDDTGFQSQKPK